VLEHVVHTRMYVTDISSWEEVRRVHREVFGSIRPATSMIEVSRLIDPARLRWGAFPIPRPAASA
jgi:enamine deaminase RidA (YjgF/YER057c/UK114 family)